MFRTIPALLTALALAACSVARPVDVVLHYEREGAGPLVVRASASGDVRVEAGGRVFIRRGGQEYIVMQDAAGSFVARAADYQALLDQAADAAGPGLPGPVYEWRGEAGETELLAGVRGTKWMAVQRYAPSLPAVVATVSPDPSLAPAARGLALAERLIVAENTVPNGGPGSLDKAVIALFDKGLVTQISGAFRLDRLDPGPVAAQEFELSSEPLSRAALQARLAAN